MTTKEGQRQGKERRRQLGGVEGDGGDLGGAVEADGEADRAEAAVDVELRFAVGETEEAFDVLFAHGGEAEWREEGETDLSAVGVAGEDEIGAAGAGVTQDGVGEVGLVAHDDERAVELGGDGAVEVGLGVGDVVEAGEPETLAVALDGKVLVDERGDAVAGEGVEDALGADLDVVVAEDGVAEGALEVAQDLGATVGGLEGEGPVTRTGADVVAGEEDEVGLELVDAVDGVLEEGGLGELLEVDVAELGDAEAVEGVGEAGDVDVAVLGDELVAGDLGGVNGEASEGEAGAGEEAPTVEAGGFSRAGGGLRRQSLGGVTGHSS
jgi:hypothetical protein